MKLSATERRNLQTLLLMSVFEPERIGARIAQARKESGLTQEELGDLVGLATRTVQNHEAGSTAPYKHLRSYAAVLRVDQRWLIHGDEQAQQRPAVSSADRLAQMERNQETAVVLLQELAASLDALREALEHHHTEMQTSLEKLRHPDERSRRSS